MEPPLGSQPCPLGLVYGQAVRCSEAHRGSPQSTFRNKSPRSIDPESPGEPREADNLRTSAKAFFSAEP